MSISSRSGAGRGTSEMEGNLPRGRRTSRDCPSVRSKAPQGAGWLVEAALATLTYGPRRGSCSKTSSAAAAIF